MHEEPEPLADRVSDLASFFRALGPAARREYEALAKRDLEFGEDVLAEARRGEVGGKGTRA